MRRPRLIVAVVAVAAVALAGGRSIQRWSESTRDGRAIEIPGATSLRGASTIIDVTTPLADLRGYLTSATIDSYTLVYSTLDTFNPSRTVLYDGANEVWNFVTDPGESGWLISSPQLVAVDDMFLLVGQQCLGESFDDCEYGEIVDFVFDPELRTWDSGGPFSGPSGIGHPLAAGADIFSVSGSRPPLVSINGQLFRVNSRTAVSPVDVPDPRYDTRCANGEALWFLIGRAGRRIEVISRVDGSWVSSTSDPVKVRGARATECAGPYGLAFGVQIRDDLRQLAMAYNVDTSRWVDPAQVAGSEPLGGSVHGFAVGEVGVVVGSNGGLILHDDAIRFSESLAGPAVKRDIATVHGVILIPQDGGMVSRFVPYRWVDAQTANRDSSDQ